MFVFLSLYLPVFLWLYIRPSVHQQNLNLLKENTSYMTLISINIKSDVRIMHNGLFLQMLNPMWLLLNRKVYLNKIVTLQWQIHIVFYFER